MKGKWQYLKELRELTPKNLVDERSKLQKEVYDAKMKNAVRGLKQTHQIGVAKKKIARINTVLKSKVTK